MSGTSSSNLPPDDPLYTRWRTSESIEADSTSTSVIIEDASTGTDVPRHQVQPNSPVDINVEDFSLQESTRSVRVRSDAQYRNEIRPGLAYREVTDFVQTTMEIPGHTNRLFGFEAEDLMNGNAVHCSPCRPSNLGRPTLKIFHPHNFIDTPDDVYGAIAPALALAQNLILYGNPHHFVSMIWGTRAVDQDLTRQTGNLHYRLTSIPTDTIPRYLPQLISLLESMGNRIQFRFEDIDGDAWGIHYFPGHLPRIKVDVPGWGSEDADKRMINIGLSIDFYLIAREYAVTQWPDEAQKLRTSFLLAVTVCHELCHALDAYASDLWWVNYCAEIQRHHGLQAVVRLPLKETESLWDQDNTAEAGGTWEQKTFRGLIQPVGWLVSAKYGILLWNGANNSEANYSFWTNIHAQKANVVVIPMGFMEELQQTDYWSRQDIVKSLFVPISGLTTLSGLQTTTVSWRDHLLRVEEQRRCRAQVRQSQNLGASLKRRLPRTPSPEMRKRVATSASLSTNSVSEIDSPNGSRVSRIMNSVRRHVQTPIRKYVSQSMQSKAEKREELIEAVLRARWESKLEQNRQHAAAEAQHTGVAPEVDQNDIHELFEHDHEDDSASSVNSDDAHDHHERAYDALRIPVDRLRVQDKWILCEEFAVLALNWDTPAFLAKRHTQQLSFIPRNYHPENPKSWSNAERRNLWELRLQNPGRSWPEQRDARRKRQAATRHQFRIMSEMEEFATLRGYSRIQFNNDIAFNRPLPFGMTLQNFEQSFRSLLHTEREISKLKRSEYYATPEERRQAPGPLYKPDAIRQWLNGLEPDRIDNYTLPTNAIESQRQLVRFQEEQRLRVAKATRLANNINLFNWLPWIDRRPDDFQDASGAVRTVQRVKNRTYSAEKRKGDRHKMVEVDDEYEEEVVVSTRRMSL